MSKGETTMMKCITNDSNILIPQKIKWSDINIPEDWSIQSDTIVPNQENIENTSLHSITQNDEGLVKIMFDKTVKTHPNSENLREKFNYLNICDEKIDQLHPHRSSISSIRSRSSNYFDTKTNFSETSNQSNYFDTKTKLSEISNQSNILKGIYTENDFQNSQNDSLEIDETISPTYSEMKPPSQFMMIIINKPFEINKDLIRKDFLQEKYLRKRNRFFRKYSETEQNNILTTWYEYMTKIKAHVMFFDYLKIYINQQENKKYFEEEKFLEESKNLEKENKHFPTEEIIEEITDIKIQETK
ncbi:hypothetical protein CFOL_v3_31457 [Cephalotus follicularis]|uniref:DUF7588 domain-containing protein n=1 Tax=Cephalotus follicularis TaxID=3775 RepID=A0A1Q3D6U4_CEPFO|nr:hypothetical protein CFOL_v3_31457 [Cephalotus follicularis]